VRAS